MRHAREIPVVWLALMGAGAIRCGVLAALVVMQESGCGGRLGRVGACLVSGCADADGHRIATGE